MHRSTIATAVAPALFPRRPRDAGEELELRLCLLPSAVSQAVKPSTSSSASISATP